MKSKSFEGKKLRKKMLQLSDKKKKRMKQKGNAITRSEGIMTISLNLFLFATDFRHIQFTRIAF